MNVIGIDPSLTATGIATADRTSTVVYPSDCHPDDRLAAIFDDVSAACSEHGTADTFAVIEDLPTHAHGAGKTGMAHGVVRFALTQFAEQWVTVPPATLKKFATGRGNATKADMRVELYKRTTLDLRDDNQVDAWWLRQIGLHLRRQSGALSLPASHLTALDKLETR